MLFFLRSGGLFAPLEPRAGFGSADFQLAHRNEQDARIGAEKPDD